jgi:hypothetical protein
LTTKSIFVLTTNGPVSVQRVAKEAAEVRSVICLNGTATSLPISRDYDAFVRAPTGVIERMTGHSAYRVDVEAEIDAGLSWQLAVYLAHAVQLVDVEKEMVVFASGEVDHDLMVRPVQHLDRKLDALRAYLADWHAPHAEPIVLLPKEQDGVPDSVSGARLVQVGSIDEALTAIGVNAGLHAPKVADTSYSPAPLPTKGRTISKVFLVLVFMFLICFAGGFTWTKQLREHAESGQLLQLEQEFARLDAGHLGESLSAKFYRAILRARAPQVDQVDLAAEIEKSSDTSSCVPLETMTLDEAAEPLRTSEPVCALTWRGNLAPGAGVLVGRLGYFARPSSTMSRPTRTLRGSGVVNGRTWRIEFATPPRADAMVRLVAVAGPVEAKGTQPWYADLLVADPESLRFRAAETRLSDLGYRIIIRDWHQD